MINPLVQGQPSFLSTLSQLQQNPFEVLRRRGFNVPENMGDPRSIVQHLLNTGQVSQSQVDQAKIMLQRFGFR